MPAPTVHNVRVIEQVREWLGYPPEAGYRIEALDAVHPVPGAFELPESGDIPALLERLDVPVQAFDEVAANRPTPEGDPEAWWIMERLYHQLTGEGPLDAVSWPTPMWMDEPLGRYLHLYVFLGAVPNARRLHAERGIGDDVSWASLGDLGLQVDRYRREYGRCGFNGAFRVVDHFRCRVFRLGRLQYDRRSVA
jgi:hypothetical protein